MADSGLIEMSHLPRELGLESNAEPSVTDRQQAFTISDIISLEQCEQYYLEWLNNKYQGDHKSLAKKLGVSERTLYRKFKYLRA